MKTTQKLAGGLVALLAVAIFAFGANTYLRRILVAPTAQTPAATSSDQNSTGPKDVSQDPNQVITFATYEFYKDGYKPLVEQFEKEHPNITVQLVTLNDYSDLRKVASAADTILLPAGTPGPYNYFLDLAPFQEGDRDFEADDFWPGILNSCQDSDGQMVGLPADVMPVGIFYQEKSFDQAGVAYPTPGWTWEDFRQTVSAMTQSDGGQVRYGFADDAFINASDDTLISPQINSLLNQTGGEIDPDQFTKEMQWYLDLVKAGQLYSGNIYPETFAVGGDNKAWAKAWNENWEKWESLFSESQPAMWKGDLQGSSWKNAQMSALEDGSITMTASGPTSLKEEGMGWVPFPVSNDHSAEATTPAKVSCLMVSSGTRRPQAAWNWLNFLSRHPYLPEYSMAAPARRSAAESLGYWARIPEKVRDAAQYALEHGSYDHFYPTELKEVNRALLQAIQENVTLTEALQSARTQVSQAPVPTPDEALIEVPEPLGTPAPGTTVIDYVNTGLKEESLQALAEEFNRLHPDVTVRIASSMGDPGPASLAEDYDCFSWYSPAVAEEYGTPGQFDPVLSLDSFLNGADAALREDFDPESLNEFSIDGQQVGLPLSYMPTLVLYNADLLASKGIQPPANDWDIDTALELFQAAASENGEDRVYGVALGLHYKEMGLLTGSRNLLLGDLNTDPPVINFDQPETRDFVQWTAGLVKDGTILPVWTIPTGETSENYTQARQLILDGKVAFWLDVPTNDGGKYQLSNAGFKIGMVPLPRMAGENAFQVNQLPRGQYISKNAENPQACWDWMKYVSEHPEAGYETPARRSMLASSAWEAAVGKDTAEALRAASAQRPLYRQLPSNDLGWADQWWLSVLEAAFRGGDPLTLLAGAQQKADIFTTCMAGRSTSYDDQAACYQQAEPQGNQK